MYINRDLRRLAKGTSEGDSDSYVELQRYIKRSMSLQEDGYAGWVIRRSGGFLEEFWEGEGWGEYPQTFRVAEDAKIKAASLKIDSIENGEEISIYIDKVKLVTFDRLEVTKKFADKKLKEQVDIKLAKRYGRPYQGRVVGRATASNNGGYFSVIDGDE